jgi:hypothetical protein
LEKLAAAPVATPPVFVMESVSGPQVAPVCVMKVIWPIPLGSPPLLEVVAPAAMVTVALGVSDPADAETVTVNALPGLATRLP